MGSFNAGIYYMITRKYLKILLIKFIQRNRHWLQQQLPGDFGISYKPFWRSSLLNTAVILAFSSFSGLHGVLLVSQSQPAHNNHGNCDLERWPDIRSDEAAIFFLIAKTHFFCLCAWPRYKVKNLRLWPDIGSSSSHSFDPGEHYHLQCANCQQDHPAYARTYAVYQREKEIIEI